MWPQAQLQLLTTRNPQEETQQSSMKLKQHALLWLVKRNQVRCFCEVWSPSTSYCVVNSVSRPERGRHRGVVVYAAYFGGGSLLTMIDYVFSVVWCWLFPVWQWMLIKDC